MEIYLKEVPNIKYVMWSYSNPLNILLQKFHVHFLFPQSVAVAIQLAE